MWYRILEAKYMHDGNFFKSRQLGSSQFWQDLHKVKHLFKWGAIFRMKSGKKTFFSQDVWLDNIPPKQKYPDLYNICEDPFATVAECNYEHGWEIGLHRYLSQRNLPQWQELMNQLQRIH